jgi:ribosomal protein S18 acetylase RimI-like enzyme
MNDSSEVDPPSVLHPAFYGCFDWHSSVHGHWLLVRLLGLFPGMPEADEIRKALDENLSAENLIAEAEYFRQENRASFERTYGWAWLLKLAEETGRCPDPAAARWKENLRPLVDVIIENYFEFLPKQTYPIKRGVHPNTAFGLSFALDYAWSAGNVELAKLITDTGKGYFFGCAAMECPAPFCSPESDQVTIREAHPEKDIETVCAIFLEYGESLGFDLCFQDFDRELEELPGDYAAPRGRILLAEEEGEVAGCVALRDIGEGMCEMKRLYVRPGFRGRGTGRELAENIVEIAGGEGYRKMRLDTLASMKIAIALYRSMGFNETGPYRYNPIDGAVYLELDLAEVS